MADPMSNDPSNVTLGKFKVGGYAYWAPKGTPLPTDVSTPLPAAFKGLGFLNEDGVTLATDTDTAEVKDANGTTVLKVVSSYSETAQFVLLETMRAEAARLRYGDDAVDGEDRAMTIRHQMPSDDGFVLVFEMAKTGGLLGRLVIGNASRAEFGDRQDHAGDPSTYDVTCACNDMGDGVTSIEYIGQAEPTTPLPKPVEAVTLDPAEVSVAQGKTVSLTVAFTPTDADDQGFDATIDDTTRATATIDGTTVTVTGVKATDAGKPATLTVTSHDGGKTATARVTVTAA